MQNVNRKTQLPLKEESVGTQRAVSMIKNRNASSNTPLPRRVREQNLISGRAAGELDYKYRRIKMTFYIHTTMQNSYH